MIELYGEGNGMISTSLLYVFDNSKDKTDWNAFYGLTTLKANATANGLISTAMEIQVPNFDLGIDGESGLKFTFASFDGYGNSDTTDISDLSRNVESQEECIEAEQASANGKYNGNQIVIDGNFSDWEQNSFFKSDNDDSLNANADILRYSNLTEESGDTFYYINVEGEILGGTLFGSDSAMNKAKFVGYDITLNDEDLPKVEGPLPTLNNEDQIFVFIDSDYNVSTGYMSESIGADKLIEIKGHYGVITSSTISSYNPNPEIENDWNWIGKSDTPAANDEDEIEILGETGNYYLYIESWDYDKDDIETEIYNRIDLPVNETAKDGSRGGVSWPSTWTTFVTDADDGLASDVEILSVAYGTDTDHIYFRIETEADADLDDSTFGVLLNDVSNSGQTFEAVCATGESGSGTKRPYIYEWDDEWGSADSQGASHYRLNQGAFSGVDLACDKADFGFTFVIGTDTAAAVSTDEQVDAFDGMWSAQNTPSTNLDDITSTAVVPEFSSLFMPIASVIGIVGYNSRLRRKQSN